MNNFLRKYSHLSAGMIILAAFSVFFILAFLPAGESAAPSHSFGAKFVLAAESSGDIIFKPAVGIPGSSKFGPGGSAVISGSTIAEYIKDWYKFSVSVLGILAVIMIMVGGFRWVTAAGKQDTISAAKKNISSAVMGLLLAICSYTILNLVDVSLVQFKTLSIKKVTGVSLAGRCEKELEVACGTKYKLDKGNIQIITDGNCIGRKCTQGIEYACLGQADGSYKCEQGLADGADCKDKCGKAGRCDFCAGGFCGNVSETADICTRGAPGQGCNSSNECLSGLCQSVGQDSCSEGVIGSYCEDNKDCRNGNLCNEDQGMDCCVSGTTYSRCNDNGDCRSGLACQSAPYATDCVNQASLTSFGGKDSNDKYCLPPGAKVCDCDNNGECTKNANPYGTGGYCSTYRNNFCTDGSAGSPCDSNDNCQSRHCDMKFNVCTNGATGEGCASNAGCTNGHCFIGSDIVSFRSSPKFSDRGYCVSGDAGSKCDDNSDCNSGLTCHSRYFVCYKP